MLLKICMPMALKYFTPNLSYCVIIQTSFLQGSMIASIQLYDKGLTENEVKEAMEESKKLPSKNSENCT